MSHRLPPLAVTALLAALMWGAAGAWPQFSWHWPPAHGLALAVGGGAVIVCLLGVASFRRASTTVNPTRPEGTSALVVGGVYRYSRNPMYLGFLLGLVAWGLWLANLPALAGGPLLLVLWLDRFQIIPEERVLESKFGDDYRAYKRQVRRWL